MASFVSNDYKQRDYYLISLRLWRRKVSNLYTNLFDLGIKFESFSIAMKFNDGDGDYDHDRDDDDHDNGFELN